MASAKLKRAHPHDHSASSKKNKKPKRQAAYHSSSDEGSEQEPETEPIEPQVTTSMSREDGDDDFSTPDDDSEVDEEEGLDDMSDNEGPAPFSTSRKVKKRHDPDAFAASMARILDSKLSTSQRRDPLLSRSKDVSARTKELQDAKLEAKARNKIREDKRRALEQGRVTDVLGVESTEVDTAEIVELERRLRRTAQKGVIKLFNAVRAAQVKGEQAEREAREKGVIGIHQREEKITEMSKQGFLDLIAGGGKPKP